MDAEEQVRTIAERHELNPEALAKICGSRSVAATEGKLRSYGRKPRKWTRRDLERIAEATGSVVMIGDVEALSRIIEMALSSYQCSESDDGDGGSVHLDDVLSAAGDETVASGRREIESLTEHLLDALGLLPEGAELRAMSRRLHLLDALGLLPEGADG